MEKKNKVNTTKSLENDIELERNDKNDIDKKGYDFIARFNHLESLDEQKLKVEKIENIGK